MGFRLKTSKKTKEYFDELTKSTNLKPFTLCKIAFALSIKCEQDINEYESTNVLGMELQRSTVTGDEDILYKALVEMNLKRHISDDEFYPNYMKLHIDRGTELLYNRYQYAGGSLEKFLTSVLVKGDAI